jgi:hypothetical protein
LSHGVNCGSGASKPHPAFTAIATSPEVATSGAGARSSGKKRTELDATELVEGD